MQVTVKLTAKGNSNGTRYSLYYLLSGETFNITTPEHIISGFENQYFQDLMSPIGVVVEVPDDADRIVIVDIGWGSNNPICEGEGLGYVIILIDKRNCIV